VESVSAENDGTPMKFAINTSSCHLIWPSVRSAVFNFLAKTTLLLFL